MMGEIINHRHAAHRTAHFQSALDAAEAGQGLQADRHRDAGMPRRRQRRDGVGPIVRPRQIETLDPALQLARQSHLKAA